MLRLWTLVYEQDNLVTPFGIKIAAGSVFPKTYDYLLSTTFYKF